MPRPTTFVARSLGLLPCEPPPPKRGSRRYGGSAGCWLCGGPTDGVGWLQEAAIAPTFTQHNTAQRPDSDAVCQACVALTRAETFQAMVSRRAVPIKLWVQAGWHSYSHHVRDDHYEAPTPARMRDILTDPPAGNWLLAINTTGKKHTIFRGAVATGRESFPVQVDETTVWTSRSDLLACLGAFERLTALGCGKDGVETGAYHPADAMRAGLARWLPAEQEMADWRARAPHLVALVRIIARSAKSLADSEQAARPADPAPSQGALL